MIFRLTVSAQIINVDDNSASVLAPLTGVGTTTGLIISSSAATNYNFNPDLSAGTPASGSNSGSADLPSGVVDLGLHSDSLKSLELYASGTFNIVRISDGFGLGGGNISSISTSTWGISNSFSAGGNEYVWLGYIDLSSTKTVGLYNLTADTFTPTFAFTSAYTPTGLGNYIGIGATGTSIYDQRILVTQGAGTLQVLDFGADGSLGTVYDIAGATNSTFTDTAVFSGNLYLVGATGTLEFGSFTGLSAVPEPATFAACLGSVALMIAGIHRRNRRRL